MRYFLSVLVLASLISAFAPFDGRASADLTRSSGFELVKSMIPLMVEELGNTVKQRSFTTR